MLNSNDYDRGYQEGFNHALAEKPKDYRGMATLKSFIRGNHTMNTYTQGYDAGYLDGLRKRNNVFGGENTSSPSSNTKPTSMQRGIDGQIELLNQMEAFLRSVTEQLEGMVSTQQNFLHGLDSEGIDLKLLQRFEEYFDANRNRINDLVRTIESEDLPYTQQVIRYLEDTPR